MFWVFCFALFIPFISSILPFNHSVCCDHFKNSNSSHLFVCFKPFLIWLFCRDCLTFTRSRALFLSIYQNAHFYISIEIFTKNRDLIKRSRKLEWSKERAWMSMWVSGGWDGRVDMLILLEFWPITEHIGRHSKAFHQFLRIYRMRYCPGGILRIRSNNFDVV